MHGLVIHGGAYKTRRDFTAHDEFLREVLAEGHKRLAAGESALDVAVQAVAMMEDCGLFHAGRGTGRNSAGYHELDASLMDGATGQAGAVASLRTIRNPIRAAQMVMEKSPHVFMVAEGAENFLRHHGIETVDPDTYFRHDMERDGPAIKDTAHGTVGAVALDRDGRLAAATSTAGIPNKLEGRVGDTPIIGAATFADDRIALSATGHGEYFIRAVAAYDVAAQCRYAGRTLDAAMDDVLQTKIGEKGGWGGMIAITRGGDVKLGFNATGMHGGFVLEDGHIHVGVS
ncbi:MAG: isoaspartyl peptidase/L-asparaginase [Micavibrio aeruginosavorus]|uniref:Isoaspartyl peptidase n=1 Tax=Micavibrio aeruginosavorus TaxID=349221 RepID=A0A7T5R0I5_9BACT|nr:MAG: isoaspartyl peptidase/L-asparaginase [Micavibrio aeruginosavorus]